MVVQASVMEAPGSLSPASRRSVELVDSLDGLREDWMRLAAESGNAFATWEWNELWWRHYGGGRRPRRRHRPALHVGAEAAPDRAADWSRPRRSPGADLRRRPAERAARVPPCAGCASPRSLRRRLGRWGPRLGRRPSGPGRKADGLSYSSLPGGFLDRVPRRPEPALPKERAELPQPAGAGARRQLSFRRLGDSRSRPRHGLPPPSHSLPRALGLSLLRRPGAVSARVRGAGVPAGLAPPPPHGAGRHAGELRVRLHGGRRLFRIPGRPRSRLGQALGRVRARARVDPPVGGGGRHGVPVPRRRGGLQVPLLD